MTLDLSCGRSALRFQPMMHWLLYFDVLDISFVDEIQPKICFKKKRYSGSCSVDMHSHTELLISQKQTLILHHLKASGHGI